MRWADLTKTACSGRFDFPCVCVNSSDVSGSFVPTRYPLEDVAETTLAGLSPPQFTIATSSAPQVLRVDNGLHLFRCEFLWNRCGNHPFPNYLLSDFPTELIIQKHLPTTSFVLTCVKVSFQCFVFSVET